MSNIEKEVRSAISWLAAEYKYTKNLMKDLILIQEALENKSMKDQIKVLNKVRKDLRQIGRSERKSQKHEERVAEAVKFLLENHQFGPDAHSFNSDDLSRLEKELHIATNKLILLTSLYGGKLKKIYGQLADALKEGDVKKAKGKIDELKRVTDDAISWMRAEVTLIKKVEQVEINEAKTPEEQNNLETLKKEIYSNAGFFVYMWGFDTPEYNDYLKADETYTRIAYMIRDNKIGLSDYNKIITNIEKNMNIRGSYTLFCDYGGVSNIVIYGALQLADSNEELYTAPIKEFTTINSNEIAFYVYIRFPIEVTDGAGRPVQDAALVIISEIDLITKIGKFLFDNPEKYLEFVKTILDAEKFPKFNNTVLKTTLELKGDLSKIYFINTDTKHFGKLGAQERNSWKKRNLRGSDLARASISIVEIPQH